MEIKTEIREFVASHYLPDTSAETISDTMPLITSGIIDSIGMLGLVDFIESRYAIEFMPREIDVHALDTVERITSLIRAKLSGGKAGVDQANIL
ncbi:MAG: acyl carrier protein [Terracidiphilus sp.]